MVARKTEKKRVARKTKPLSKKKPLVRKATSLSKKKRVVRKTKPLSKKKKVLGGQEKKEPLMSKEQVKSMNNDIEKYGMTPLIWASKNGHNEIVNGFLENRADVNARDNTKMTALMWASNMGHEEISTLGRLRFSGSIGRTPNAYSTN